MLGDIFEIEHIVDMQDRFRLFRFDMLFHILLEPVAESLHVFPSDGEARRVGMPAEVEQQVTATLDGGIYVKARDTAGGTCRQVSFTGKHDSRAEVDFRQSGGDDAYYAFLP